MPARLTLLLSVTALFGLLTAIALLDVGYFGILEPHFRSWGAAQVLADLVIACALGSIWIVLDGRERGISPWPFVVTTLFLGSFGLLGYLIARELRSGARAGVAAGAAR
jgi:hypothetical protein